MIQVLPGPRASHQGWNTSYIRGPVLVSFPNTNGEASGEDNTWELVWLQGDRAGGPLALRWVVVIMTKPSLFRGIIE